jgi:hypothetical protein
MKNFKVSDNDIKMFKMIFDIPLDAKHPRYKLQKLFFEFAKEYPQVKVETADLYNDGGCIGIHFEGDEFIVLCDMDDKTIESSILVDYENASFNVIEMIPFSWDSLKTRLNDMISITPWTQTFEDCEDVDEARQKAVNYLKEKWKTK